MIELKFIPTTQTSRDYPRKNKETWVEKREKPPSISKHLSSLGPKPLFVQAPASIIFPVSAVTKQRMKNSRCRLSICLPIPLTDSWLVHAQEEKEVRLLMNSGGPLISIALGLFFFPSSKRCRLMFSPKSNCHLNSTVWIAEINKKRMEINQKKW